ncbi:MAG: hypothetical protein LBF19_05920 [Prevotellaceae bacterium]|jgi:hypothetical protein|nr:hypothetical protein [Prevotellaceae bacterium]
MKKKLLTCILLLTTIAGFGSISVYGQGRVVQISQIATDYAATPPTVTFDVYWDAAPDVANRHLDTVWVFIDYQPITAHVTGTWQHAVITNASVDIISGTGSIVPPGIIGGRGFFLNGHGAVPFRAKLTVTLSADLNGTKFNWCAYATDYPPNATPNVDHYILHGTPPFVVNDSTLGADEYTFTGCITSLTDATGCPGLIPTPPVITSFTASTNTLCAGDSVTLSTTATGAASYSFDDGAHWSPSNDTTLVPANSGIYTIHARNAGGCTVTYSPSIAITVNPRPTITTVIASQTTICAGDSITLTVDATGAEEYSFDDGAHWTSSSDTTLTPSTGVATYNIYARNTAGCSVAYLPAIAVTINPRPAPTLIAPVTACAGSTVTLTGGGGESYCFTQICDACVRNPYLSGNDSDGAADCFSPVIACTYTDVNTYTLVMPESGSVTVWMHVQNEHGCVDSASATITVSDLPPAISLLSGDKNPAVESGVAITPIVYKITHASDVTCTGLPNGITPVWNGGNETLTIQGIPTAGGTYTYKLHTTNTGGCANASDSGTITVAGPILHATCTPPLLMLTGAGFTSAAVYESHGIIISSPVTATTCNKETFSPGDNNPSTADCRNNSLPEYGHLFSWCMVKQYASQLCPSPWRAPTREDYCLFLTGAACTDNSETYEQKLGVYGWLPSGAAGGAEGNLSGQGTAGVFWTTVDEGIDPTYWYAYCIGVYSNGIVVRNDSYDPKATGHALRCVQDAAAP